MFLKSGENDEVKAPNACTEMYTVRKYDPNLVRQISIFFDKTVFIRLIGIG